MHKVIILEDNAQISQMLARFLSQHNFTVTCSAGGDETFDLVEQVKPDLIISDFFLAKMDGQELLWFVRTTPSLSNIKVILTSGKELDQDGFAWKADAFLQKPFNLTKLLQTVERLT